MGERPGVGFTPRRQSAWMRAWGLSDARNADRVTAMPPGRTEKNQSIERHFCLHAGLVTFGHKRRLSEIAKTLRVLAAVQVTFPLFPTQNSTRTGHLETFGERFTSFCFSTCASHSGGESSGNSRSCNPVFSEKRRVFEGGKNRTTKRWGKVSLPASRQSDRPDREGSSGWSVFNTDWVGEFSL